MISKAVSTGLKLTFRLPLCEVLSSFFLRMPQQPGGGLKVKRSSGPQTLHIFTIKQGLFLVKPYHEAPDGSHVSIDRLVPQGGPRTNPLGK